MSQLLLAQRGERTNRRGGASSAWEAELWDSHVAEFTPEEHQRVAAAIYPFVDH